jgi:aminopeptidase N
MQRNNPTAVIRLTEYRPPDYLVDEVAVEMRLHPTQTQVRVASLMRPNPARAAGVVPLELDGDELTLTQVMLNGCALDPASYTVDETSLTLHAPPQEAFRLTIETTLNPAANTKLMGLYLSNGVYCTQCEADGFRRITYFLDRPDVMATYRVRLEAEKGEAPVLLANGNRVEGGDVQGTTRHYAVWDDPHPKPCYLFAVVAGALDGINDSFTTMEGRTVDLGIYVERGKAESAHYAMDALKRSFRWDEEVFGRAYDLDVFNIVAVSDFNMGAMENKGLNIFNDKYVLASPDTATDTDYAQIEAVIAHEYFHNWTGNRITCRDWFQLCLKEGLTVFRDQEFSADMRSRAVKRIMDVRELRARQFVEDAGPLAHPVRPNAYREINNFYTATVYEKGAEVIRMLKLLIGAQTFRRGMDLYFARHDGCAATVEEFIACFAEVSGRDLTQFFQWYEQAGTPRLHAERSYDAARRTLTLKLQQKTSATPGQPDKRPQVIPLVLGFVGEGAADVHAQDADVVDGLCVLDQAERTLTFSNVAPAIVPSLLRGFSAPVNLDINLTDDELLTLARHDSDPFNRWQGLQSLAMRVLLTSAQSVRAGGAAHIHAGLADAVTDLLRDGARDPHFAALAIALPSEQDIARDQAQDVDPDAIFLARQTLRQFIGQHATGVAVQTYHALKTDDAFVPGASFAGQRALRNAALDLMIQGDEAQGAALAYAQFSTAGNMTDRLAALSALAYAGVAQRDQALAEFEARYGDNALVMDKWFALQAALPEAGTLKRVQQLMEHKAFSLSNPNRTRSLIGGFAMSNPTQFNRADGQGYSFVADMIRKIDAKNPQVAARIITGFRSWRGLEPMRRGKAQDALQKLADAKKLSRDLHDIVDRMLA